MKTIITHISLLALLLIFFGCNNQNQGTENDSAAGETSEVASDSSSLTSFINPPCIGTDVPYEAYTIVSEKGGEITYKTGSEIKFKPDAFVDESGNPVTGEITVLYREFHNPYDFFISGIPMHYDSSGLSHTFESAGMLEILAFKDGKPVFVNPKTPVSVEMKSQYESSEYNVYYLDTVAQGWQYVGKDKIVDESNNPASMANKKNIAAAVNMEKPEEPKKANINKHRFNIDVDLKQFPELKTYKGVMFELSDLDRNFDPRLYTITWDDAELSESKMEGNYNLKLYKEDTSFTFIVCPVFDGKSYDKAKKEYDAKFKQYNELLTQRKTEEPVQTNPIADETELTASTTFNPDNKTTKDLTRVFEVNKFGVWNCDKFRDFPNGEEVSNAVYADENDNPIEFVSLFFVDKSKNSLFNITSYSKWRFNPRADNLLWGVTRNNKIAVFSPSQFRRIKRSEGQCHFNMGVSDNVSALKEIKRFLGV